MTAETEATAPELSRIRHDGAREALAQAIDDLTTSEGFERWLKARATFHDYSLNNTLMILTQRPDAQRVAGYKAWQKLGRQVRKGEPGNRHPRPDGGQGHRRRDRSRGTTRAGIQGCARVRRLPDGGRGAARGARAPTGRPGRGQPARSTLTCSRWPRSEGLSIGFEPLGEGFNGYYQREQARIVLQLDLSPAQQAKTLAHELAHHFDPDKPQGAEYREHRGEAETVAEAAAYIVAQAHGLDTSAYSVGYVATWANGDSSVVYKVARRIDAAANAILADRGDVVAA